MANDENRAWLRDNLDMMWGDAGRIYFWIRAEDMTAGSWERTWLVLQCC